jgi:L-fuculose-phosphate aldolase
MTSYKLRKQLITYCHRLDAKGFVANHDGNISARLAAESRFIATPTARGKFDLRETDLIVIDQTGKTRAGTGKVFSEWPAHVEVYKNRADMMAVVHAHPPFVSSLCLTGEALPVDFWPEAVVSLGRSVPCAPNSEANAQLAAAARRASACLMQGNGVFAWGSSLEQAYLRLELVEHLAHISTLARAAGTFKLLPSDVVAGLMEKRKKAGLLSPEELTQHG